MKDDLLQIRPFNGLADYQNYCKWFEDEELNLQLGPLDQEWLDAVMSEDTHQQYSFWINDQMVAVAGIEAASAEHPYWYITDLAVKPSLRGQGIGGRVLATLCVHHANSRFRQFKCGVMKSNAQAARFLEKHGWKRLESSTDSPMWEYQMLAESIPSGSENRAPRR